MRSKPDPIRVFHLIKSLGRGGAEMLLPEGLRFANRAAFDYHYGYFLPWKNAMVPALRQQNAEVTCFGSRSSAGILLSAHRVAQHLRSIHADVLHCHLPVAGTVGRLAGRLAGIPVIYSEHNKQERYHPATRYLNRLTWAWQARVVAVSGDVAESIQSHIRSSVPVRVILNGVDVERFERSAVSGSAVRARLGIPDDAPVIGTVAVFRVQKRLQDWLEAARQIRELYPMAHFLLVGDGPLRDDVRSWIEARGLRDRVHTPGLQEEVRPYLAATDIYLMSSLFEGLPIALLEAMAMECAPVCTAVGGIPEVIRSGENGMVAPPCRPDLLAGAVADLLESPDFRRGISVRARQTVIERFSMSRMARQLEETYLEVVELHRDGH